MTPEERTRMDWLCMRIQEEKDRTIFDQLVQELGELIEAKLVRLNAERNNHPDRN